MPRFLKQGSHHFKQYRLDYGPHERLALLLAKFGDWTQQPDLAESRVEDVLLAHGGLWDYVQVLPAPTRVAVPQQHRNYHILVRPCAVHCIGDVVREVDLFDPEKIGRLVELFVPRVNA